MAKLKAIGMSEFNLSQQGSATQTRQQEESTAAMNEAPVLSETFKIFKLSDTKKNGKYHMEGIDDVWNPKRLS